VQTFLEYFFGVGKNPFMTDKGNKKLLNSKEPKNPHHRTDRRLTNRGVEVRNGKEEGMNIIANRYKQGDHNYKQKISDGSISNQQAQEMASKSNVNLPEVGKSVKLRKSGLVLKNNGTNFSLSKI